MLESGSTKESTVARVTLRDSIDEDSSRGSAETGQTVRADLGSKRKIEVRPAFHCTCFDVSDEGWWVDDSLTMDVYSL